MADNDDYEIQYQKYLEKIGMTPPNIGVRQTPSKQKDREFCSRQLFQNTSQQKELNYQRINSIIVLNNQLEINLTNKQSQSKIQNISLNLEAKSPIVDIQTSLIKPIEQKNQKGLAQIDEFADDNLQENSNKTNCFDSNIQQEQIKNENLDQQNLDFSSIQLRPTIVSKSHDEIQGKTQEEKKDTQLNNQTIEQNNNFEIKQQNSLIKNLFNENNQDNSEQIQTPEKYGEIENKIIFCQEKEKEQNLQPEIIEENKSTKEIQSQQFIIQDQNQFIPQQQTPKQESNIEIVEAEIAQEFHLEMQQDENNLKINNNMDIEQMNQPESEEQVDKQETFNINKQQFLIENQLQEEINQEPQDHEKNQNNIENPIVQQELLKQREVEKLKKKQQKQKKSRINNKKKKRGKKNKSEQKEQEQQKKQEQVQDKIIIQEQIVQVDESLQNNNQKNEDNYQPIQNQIIQVEQNNPICNFLQQLIGGFCREDIKINWNKFTFLKRKIYKKRSILLKSKLLI
ncbi:unnamed protein product [Paramecium sonneborni]|uniref:Uncharacterized protein n=1 Tax=Paramecium sonneborni TaxID=65129 RepID=A0A8S1LXW6_9CILI|nr:unnamed protein product [Paramecium sonneborni]